MGVEVNVYGVVVCLCCADVDCVSVDGGRGHYAFLYMLDTLNN